MRSELPVRLKMIADLASGYAKEGSRLIDVGADHGLLSVYCLKNGFFENAVLTDVNEGPAARARSAIGDNCLTGRAEVIVTDGLDNVEIQSGDVVVMAGLGGLNMRDIMGRLQDRPQDILKSVTFVLQPQKSLPELREWLSLNGYLIVDEECCFEAGFYYCAICVQYKGEVHPLSDREIYYGPVMLDRFDQRQEYKEFLDRVFDLRSRSDGRIKRVLEDWNEQGNS
ncbi:MAG: SAM-dependent methyltransferase [Clostridiales bacterium]|nr:SAM-dependent methyltransferase [Clostridiales bacterium]